MHFIDSHLRWTFAGLLGLLTTASTTGYAFKLFVKDPAAEETISNLITRIRSWWVMTAVFVLMLVVGPLGSTVMFAAVSILALREYVTLLPTRRADHRALFWSFFIFTPLQYLLVGMRWYGMFAILIPVYAFLLVPTRLALAGDTKSFLQRASETQWGLMVCVYCLSYAPALLMLKIPNYGPSAKLLLFLVLVDQGSDVLQYVWGKLLGRRRIAPEVSPNKTWEGFIGGALTATGVGAAMWWTSPFTPLAAAAIAFVITMFGFAGGLTMSAIKRDRGVKDYGTLIRGHGGILDRVDSMCFAAPVFFHIVRFFYVR